MSPNTREPAVICKQQRSAMKRPLSMTMLQASMSAPVPKHFSRNASTRTSSWHQRLCEGFLCLDATSSESTTRESQEEQLQQPEDTSKRKRRMKHLWQLIKSKTKRKEKVTWYYSVLQGNEIHMYPSSLDAKRSQNIQKKIELDINGREGFFNTNGLQVHLKTTCPKEDIVTLRAFNRSDLAQWVTALHRLSFPSPPSSSYQASSGSNKRQASIEEEEEKEDEEEDTYQSEEEDEKASSPMKMLHFRERISVKVVPGLSDKEKKELFYSSKEIQKFMSKATSRTHQFFTKYFPSSDAYHP